ncbi:MAG TPA: ectoine synthase [Polyangiaceae bacterium LLY-WYZ-15_(1-7)]|nr:L-ectoine synthase [Myxococcales bacterium]MAT28888.1 L-ectoine synthase [Sandaracinus sp.]HJK93607.1 ectoine synthase [Polyangiaceae bacterium LLY-WYZ-15_(1-7)]MBJ70688.1 L-ectoine synthase [Sandaracinus sp.]HJL01742.1 ectoine synthase [Polyangiaceae bacterium LLY-WYZ-15_(1-7)]|tara:strand:+ start:224 stop:610 length:387 start_codon:yes stop_codon:yes gene_type:complete
MILVKLDDVAGSDLDVHGEGWNSRRLLLKDAKMGFSLHDTLIHEGAELHLHYKNHLEAVYCIEGTGSIEDLAKGETHPIAPGTVYALDQHDEHILRAQTQMRMVCVFNPPVTGKETHGPDGSYELVED